MKIAPIDSLSLEKFADLLNLELKLTYQAKQAGPWRCQFHMVGGQIEFKTNELSHLLESFCGYGRTPEDAMEDYHHKIWDGRYAVMVLRSNNEKSRFFVQLNSGAQA